MSEAERLAPMEQLLAFCDFERQQNPGKKHVAEWAAERIEADAAALTEAKELADSEGTRAVAYLRRARKAEAEVEREQNNILCHRQHIDDLQAEVEALRRNQRCAGLEGDETGSPCNTYKMLEARHAEEVEALKTDIATYIKIANDEAAEVEALKGDLETERLRLAACGVVATADTLESAVNARQMLPQYRSASCDDVARRVDECIKLRAEVEALRKDAERYRWLRDVSVPPHNFYISVPIEFDGVRYTPAEVDAAIDATMKGKP